MKNYILVTGGAGFIGSNLIKYLLKKTKYKILSLDNYSTGLIKNQIKSNRVKYIKGENQNITKLIKSYKNNIKVTIGGNLTFDSYDFIKNFNKNELEAFESRKCTFFNSNNLDRNYFKEIINKALDFELSWLNLKRNMYSVRSEEENIRIFKIKERFKY